jgi:ATP-dependent Lon protease
MSLDMKDYNILGSIINTTYAGSSQSQKNSAYNVNVSISGNVMTFTCITVVNLIDHYRMETEVRKCEKECNQVINHYVGQVKKDFKSESKKALKLKKIKNSEDTSTELAGYYSPYSPKRTAYIKRKIDFEVG